MYNSLQESILSTLAYFDLFNHPLKLEEVTLYLHGEGEKEQVEYQLIQLKEDGFVFKVGKYYSLQNESKWASRREKANKLARSKMKTALKMCRIIASMPYVRSILLSGTISKGVMYDDSDIDYFIITKSNRLWIAKLFVVLYKKIFLLNSKKNYCVNYFLSEKRMEIEDKNLFTATELATLVPIYNVDVALNFRSHNQWIKEYLPNHSFYSNRQIQVRAFAGLPKRMLERILQGKMGNLLEKKIMNRVEEKYRKSYRGMYNQKDFTNNFLTTQYASKVHNSNHRSIALKMYNQRIEEIFHLVTNGLDSK